MPHQVLERLGVHSRFCHVAAVGMAADVGRDVRHLHPVDIVVPLDHVVEAVFPMHGYQWVAVLIREKEPAVPVDHLFKPRRLPVLNNPAETLRHVLCHGQLPCPRVRLGGFNDQTHIGSPLELVVDVDDLVLQVDILKGQPAEFRNAHPRVEKDIDHFVILAVDIVVMDEFQELPHLVLCDGFPRHAVIDHHPGKLKAEGVLHQHVIVHRHLESRAQDAPHRLYGAVMPSVLLQLDQEQFCVRCFDL